MLYLIYPVVIWLAVSQYIKRNCNLNYTLKSFLYKEPYRVTVLKTFSVMVHIYTFHLLLL